MKETCKGSFIHLLRGFIQGCQSWGLGSRPPRFWSGAGRGGCRGLWTGLGKYYIVFWTKSMLESDYFSEKNWQECKLGVNGYFVINEQFLS